MEKEELRVQYKTLGRIFNQALYKKGPTEKTQYKNFGRISNLALHEKGPTEGTV